MSTNYSLLRFPNEESLAQSVADYWVKEMNGLGDQVRFCVALSGGRITQRYFTTIAQQSQKAGLRLNQVHFFWADERCVPPSDPESNYRLASQTLLTPLGIPPSRVHRIRGEIEPEEAAREADNDLRQVVTEKSKETPVLDLVLLGMGEDGHIASLFPNQSSPETRAAAYYPVVAAKPPPNRITLSYRALIAARRVWVVISGQGKQASLEESLSETGQPPLAQLIRQRKFTLLLTDLPPA